MAPERPPTEQMLDLFVYAPVGLLLGGPKPLPLAVAKGRQCVESQVTMARLVGKFAVDRGTHRVRLRVARLLEQSSSSRPADEFEPNDGAPPTAEMSWSPTGEHVIPVRREAVALAIPEYDALAASQVVPRLEGLSADELEAVRAHETEHRGRRTILNRIAQLQGE